VFLQLAAASCSDLPHTAIRIVRHPRIFFARNASPCECVNGVRCVCVNARGRCIACSRNHRGVQLNEAVHPGLAECASGAWNAPPPARAQVLVSTPMEARSRTSSRNLSDSASGLASRFLSLDRALLQASAGRRQPSSGWALERWRRAGSSCVPVVYCCFSGLFVLWASLGLAVTVSTPITMDCPDQPREDPGYLIFHRERRTDRGRSPVCGIAWLASTPLIRYAGALFIPVLICPLHVTWSCRLELISRTRTISLRSA
jgi:hypothetical protein